VLGAPEMLLPYLEMGSSTGDGVAPSMSHAVAERVRALAGQGLRVLLLAHAPQASTLEDRGDASELPESMRPLGLVALGDELRPEAREALSAFLQAGVQPKIISGDNPETVAALARQAGMASGFEAVSGPELDRMCAEELDATAESASVFGRITPQQKERLVRALRQRGHYVAMIGDGVNDVLSLKQADLGIAMRSGSQAARGVADVVLMQDSFAVLVPAVAEGQRILNGMQDILKLFLTRISTVGLVILSSLVVGAFPLELRQGSLVTFFSVGVPAIALAVWAQPGPAPKGRLMRRLLHFILPPVVLTSTMALALFVGTYALRLAQVGSLGTRSAVLADSPVAQTTLTAFLVYCGLFLVIFVEPPTPWWTGGSRLSADRRPALLAVAMMASFAVMDFVPLLRRAFVLAPLGPYEYLLLGLALAVWVFALRMAWRSRLLSRYLSVDLN
ncbi:MAG TPA: HAD-IC family P-type ATPase, partial [Ktedonobacterales bacterium]|nr:HAD-IC family P-type ATPase [Ktedonobacterales bacterium]